MCTAITFRNKCCYFGRTLDWDFPYPCEVVITPRHFPLGYSKKEKNTDHLALIGMAYVYSGYPLYFDAANEKGLCMAGLNFPGNAAYVHAKGKSNEVPQYELIPFILSMCETVSDAKELLREIRVTDTPFCNELPTSPLHWLIADKDSSITLEITAEGTNIYDNPVDVLTNNPPFPAQLKYLNNFAHLSPVDKSPSSHDSSHQSRGTGAVGLPGDWSSPSRFVRAAFVTKHSRSNPAERDCVNRFFHIMSTVNVTKGTMQIGTSYEQTLYTCCINATKGIYYYTTYENHRITAVRITNELQRSSTLTAYSLNAEEDILFDD